MDEIKTVSGLPDHDYSLNKCLNFEIASLSPRVIFNFEQIFNRTVNRIEFYRFSTAFVLMEHKTKKIIKKTPILDGSAKIKDIRFENLTNLFLKILIITELLHFWKFSMKIFVTPAV